MSYLFGSGGVPDVGRELSPVAYLISLGMAFALGLLLSQVYRIYYQDNEPQDTSLARSLVLMTPAICTIFWLVQFSLPLSLGMLGALSFVRFRTPIKRSEDITFILLALAQAIACAAGKYVVAVMLVLLLVIYSVIRHGARKLLEKDGRYAIITYNSMVSSDPQVVSAILLEEFKKSTLMRTSTHDGITSYVFNVPNVSSSSHKGIIERLNKLDDKSRINVFYPNDRIGA